MYLPNKEVVTKDFLKQVFAGVKELLKKDEVVPISVPYYDELSVKNLWPQFEKDAKMMAFFPDVFPKGKAPRRRPQRTTVTTRTGRMRLPCYLQSAGDPIRRPPPPV